MAAHGPLTSWPAGPAEADDGGLHGRVDLRRGTFDLSVPIALPRGRVLAVLGPNGAGKSTLLQALAGLLPLRSGQIRFGSVVWDDPAQRVRLPAQDRGVGLVVADHLLFGHLSARDNAAFGPRVRGVGKGEARRRGQDELDALGIGELAARRPGTLSSGQAQRVALARALAARPGLLLLDEPLSALDPTTRAQVRVDLRRRLSDFAGATVLVTHDPLDALSMADKLLFLDDGQVVQTGVPLEVIARPRHPFVAQFVGLNLLRGNASGHHQLDIAGVELTVGEGPPTGEVLAAIAPTKVRVSNAQPSAPVNCWRCRVKDVALAGQVARVTVVPLGAASALSGLAADVPVADVAALSLLPGQQVWAQVDPGAIHTYSA